jgi:hypothetical protein
MTQNSNSFMPDLEWTQVRETSKMLVLSAGQVEDLLCTSDVSVNTLTGMSLPLWSSICRDIYNHTA